ncbi:MAG: hypothetical protein WDO18_15830 [Acidobacteriota bacterium]
MLLLSVAGFFIVIFLLTTIFVGIAWMAFVSARRNKTMRGGARTLASKVSPFYFAATA